MHRQNIVLLLFVAGMLAVEGAYVIGQARLFKWAGFAAIAAAACLAPAYSLRSSGLLCLLGSALLFFVEFWLPFNYVAGLTGLALVPAGFLLLYTSPERMNPVLAIALGVLLGSSTALLSFKAKRGRLNKTADL